MAATGSVCTRSSSAFHAAGGTLAFPASVLIRRWTASLARSALSEPSRAFGSSAVCGAVALARSFWPSS